MILTKQEEYILSQVDKTIIEAKRLLLNQTCSTCWWNSGATTLDGGICCSYHSYTNKESVYVDEDYYCLEWRKG